MNQVVVGNGWVLKMGEDMHNGILAGRQFMSIVMLILYWLVKSLMDLYLTIFVEIGLALTLTTWSWLHNKRIYCGELDWLRKESLLLIVRRGIPIMRGILIFIREGVIVGLVVGREQLDMKRGQSVG